MSYEAVDVEQSAEGGGGKAPSLKLVLLLLLVVALAVFFFQNGDSAQVEFLWMDANWPVRSVIIISVTVGVLIDRLVAWQWRRARRRKAERDAT